MSTLRDAAVEIGAVRVGDGDRAIDDHRRTPFSTKLTGPPEFADDGRLVGADALNDQADRIQAFLGVIKIDVAITVEQHRAVAAAVPDP